MSPRTSPPRLRGVPLLLARIAALTVSVGVVGLLLAQTGLAGCSRGPDAQPEPRTAVAPSEPPGATRTADPAPEDDPPETKGEFFGGSKAPSGGWAKPRK